MEKGHAEKVHSTYKIHVENIGKKTTLYVKTTLSKTANQVNMGLGLVGGWSSGGRANAKHLGLTSMKLSQNVVKWGFLDVFIVWRLFNNMSKENINSTSLNGSGPQNWSLYISEGLFERF